MMRKYILFSLLIGIIALSACTSGPSTVGTAITTTSSPPTQQTSPTFTPEPTAEPYLTVGATTTTTSSLPTQQISLTLTPEPTAEPYLINVEDAPVYVRNGPGFEFNVICVLESQKKHLVIGKHVDWWLVDLGDHQSGWVYALAEDLLFFGNANAVPDRVSPSKSTSEIIPTFTPTDQTETASEGLEKARNALTTFFELLHQRKYEEAAELYGGDYQVLQGWNPSLDPQDYRSLLANGCEINGLQCLQVKRIMDEKVVSVAEYHFTVEFMKQDGSLFMRGPCCGASATDDPPESQFTYTVIKNCAGEFLVRELPVYVP